MRRLRAGLVTLPPGRSGLAVRPHYGGLQVVLLDEAWSNAGESLRDKDGRGSSGQSRKNGSGAKNRSGRCAERRPRNAGFVCADCVNLSAACGTKDWPAPPGAPSPSPCGRAREVKAYPAPFKQHGRWRSPGFPTRNEPIEDNERAIVYAVILRRSVRSTEPRRTTARIIGGRSSFEARFRSHLRMTE
jgi:hypothetical protein